MQRTNEEPIDNHPSEREVFLGGIGKHENIRITKNIIVLGFAFMIHFTAFHGTANLQSSINSDGAIGTYTLAAIYGSLILSNIFLPVAVIRWLGCKWTIALSFIAYMPFIAAQFYPRIFTLIPGGLAVGFGGGPLWCAKCTYLTVVAEAFNAIVNDETKQDVLIVRFFGLFFIFYQLAQVWGNLISSSVLSSSIGLINNKPNMLQNITDFINQTITSTTTAIMPTTTITKNVAEVCGAKFCPGITAAENPNLEPPAPVKIYILSGIFLALMICAGILVTFFVDSLERYEMGRKGSGSGLSGFKLLAVTIKQLIRKNQLLLIPITMFIGAEQAFVAVDFTASFVACGWGISRIGYVMICFGVSNAIAAAVAGAIAKITGRIPIMIAMTILHCSLLIWMRLWIAVENDFLTYCSMAAIWGLVDGIWLVQINAFYGVLFTGAEEAAFSNFRLLEATGSVITYSLSPILCTGTKLMALLLLMLIGMSGFGTVEYLYRKNLKVQINGVELQNSVAKYIKANDDL